MLRVGYDGSWFDNSIQTLIWDNPLKFTDATFAGAYSAGTAGAQGRMALWPTNTVHAVSAAGSVKLPAHTRATGTVTVGGWRQDEPLLPFTINTAIPAIPLERSTAEGEARTLAMNYTLTSRPAPWAWLNARYRYYEFDNRTPHFTVPGRVRLDQVYEPGQRETEPIGSSRHTIDLDASFTPIPFTAFKAGYTREAVDRTFRIFERTTENVARASIDTTGNRWITLRAIVERSVREGSRFEAHLLEEVGEQPTMRHFDIADRERLRVSSVLQVTPSETIALFATIAAGNDDYKNTGFGLRDNDNATYSAGIEYTPREELGLSLSYMGERYSALQRSRTASPGAQFIDPTRDWSIDSDDRVHTINAAIDVLKLIPKTELRFAYDLTRSRATYVYGVPATSTITAPQQLPPVKNELHTGTADLRYSLTDHLALGVSYWYDRYRVDDFGWGTSTFDRLDPTGSLFLGYVYRPYTVNSAWLRFIYLW